MKYIEDILALIGISLVGAGVVLEFGWGWGMVAAGSLMLLLAVIAAIKGGSNAPE